jgi:DNA-binding IclR family transcriptional regulator
LDGGGAPKRRGIKSVEIGLRVLSAVAGCGAPASLSAVAAGARLSASQAHRYLASLMAAGMVRQDVRSGLYDLDAGAIRIGLAGLARLDVFASVDAVFPAFCRETGRTCLIAVWGDAGPTIVRWYPGYPPVITSLAIGSVLPLLHSASGHVFYGFGDPQAVESKAAGAEAGALAALRARVRAEVGSRLEGDLIPGLRAISAPVFDLQGRLVLVATALASMTADAAADARAAVALRAACRGVTETLGGRWPEAK